jgi:ABC-type transport system involved in multi-copper enzyme maturation permease subunit
MSALRGLLLVWCHAFGRCLRGKRVLGLLFLAVLPVGIAALHASRGHRVDLDDFLQLFVFLTVQVVVPFAALFLGVAVLGEEIEGRTITYLYTRPLPRPVFFLGRLLGFASGFAIILFLSVVATGLLFAQRIELAAGEIAGAAGIAVAGFFAYTAFFAALRTLIRRALIVGLFLTFFIEGWISKIPFGEITRWTLWHHLSVLVARLFADRPFRVDGMESITADETAGGALLVVAGVFLVAVLAGCWIVKTREVRVPAAVA